jgi:Protein of unknown function (DUF3631)
LQRKPPIATVERLRKRDSEEFATLRRKIARWAADSYSRLEDPDPAVPDTLNDRAADNWRPLLAIADLAGATWPSRAREAACILSGEGHDTAVNIELLADLQRAFGDADVMRSADIVAKLVADPERPWAEWKHGRPLTQKQLAGLLKPFGIISGTVDPPGLSSGKGYKRVWFEETWAAYLPGQHTSPPSGTQSEAPKRRDADEIRTTCDFRSVEEGSLDGSENANLSYGHAGFDASADQNPVGGDARETDQGNGRACAQCDEAAGPMVEDQDADGNRVWLHQECRRFWYRAGRRDHMGSAAQERTCSK